MKPLQSTEDRHAEELFLDRMVLGSTINGADHMVGQGYLRAFARKVLEAAEARDTTPHYRRVRAFMRDLREQRNDARAASGRPPLAPIPTVPTDPGSELRLLRARLMFEEFLEACDGLGVSLYYELDGHNEERVEMGHVDFRADGTFDPVAVADGCGDLSVCAIGTLVECGIKDAPVLRLIDDNNAAKVGPGARFIDDKLQKPPGHRPPDIAAEIARQRNP